MSFNRLTYDSCAYAKSLQESTDPLEYNLYKGKFEMCSSNKCSLSDYNDNLNIGVRVDLESDLKGQTRIGSKCPSKKYPANTAEVVPFSSPFVCQGIYNITPTNLKRPQNSGLKDFSHYNQDICLK
jgi:hypothetical protein